MIAETVARLAAASVFKKVAGAVDFERALSTLTIDPAAFVMPLAESPGTEDGYFNAMEQEVTALIGVAIAVRGLKDAAGAEAIDVLKPYRDAVDAALFGWSPGPEFSNYFYAGGQLLGFKDGVVWWEADYATTYHKRT